MAKERKAWVVGSALPDFFFEQKNIDSVYTFKKEKGAKEQIYYAFKRGKKNEAAGVSLHLGGGGNNAATAISRMLAEWKVRLVCSVGDNSFGNMVAQMLEEQNINTEAVVRKGAESYSLSVLLIDDTADRERTPIVSRGEALAAEDIPDDLLRDAGPNDLVMLTSAGLAVTEKMLALAAEAECLFGWIPGRKELEAISEGRLRLPAAFRGKAVMSLNEDQEIAIVGEQLSQLVQTFSLILLTKGGDGSDILSRGGGEKKIIEKKKGAGTIAVEGLQIIHCRGLVLTEDDIVSTTGAGDSCMSSFMCAQALGLSDQEAGHFANCIAADVIGVMDATGGLPKPGAITTAEAMRAKIQRDLPGV